ncbi:MAG TPA: HAD-IC family P-type ATPase [Candidatus Limnocylindrales bacterium]|nr:HAD-IC family P-type ATPase [Candidatus Limnocylindrales bacterium]
MTWSIPAEPSAMSAEAVAGALATDAAGGLNAEEAAARLEAGGPNELEAAKPPTVLALVVDAVTEPFVLLLLAAGIGAVLLGEVRDGLLVLAGLIPIVGADVVTEFRAERALDELRAAGAPIARVRRAGRALDVPARELVAGDVVLLRAGDVVPADLRLTAATALAIDRSVLTGESVPEASAVAPDPPGASLVERRSMAFSGTSVVRGAGEGIVVATGPATETGRIAAALGEDERRRSPLQRELDRLVRILLVVAIFLIVVTVGSGFLRGNPPGENLLAGISAAIAAIPEEPPILLAVILGFGAHRLLRRGVLVRRLSAEETLGAVGLILTDKTGTLTQNRLAVADVLVIEGSPTEAERTAILGEAIRAEEDAWRAAGSGAKAGSFSRALETAIAEAGGNGTLRQVDLVAAEPPTEHSPVARATWRSPGNRVVESALGAPEAVLALSEAGDGDRADWLRLVGREAETGRRLLLLASRDATGDGTGDASGDGLAGVPWRVRALVAFADPIRDGVREALRTATEAGIQTVVVTGDHPATTAAIAAEAGLGAERIVTGRELDAWDDDRLDAELPTLHGVARALPEQKLRLVDAARRIGRTVAVTGDGVNDAPALHRADVAVAMGSGTAVAKGASDLVLGDDSFATLLYAVRDGRRIVDNVKKGLVFLTSTHVALLGFILVGTVVGFSQPLWPIQILWLELFIDVSTSVAFEREPEEPDVMRRQPRDRGEPLLTTGLLGRIALAGGFSALAAMAILAWHPGPPDHARWVAFTGLVVGQAVRAYANRSLTLPYGALPRNTFLAAAGILVVAIQALIPFVPVLSEAFRATSLDALDWLLVAVVAFTPAALGGIVRAVRPGTVWVA